MRSTPVEIKPRRRRRRQPKPAEIITVVVFLTLLCVTGFILVAGLLSDGRPNRAQAYALQTKQALDNVPTPTPFQPVSGNPETDSTPEPGESEELEPTPTEKVYEKPEGQVNILLLGSDVRPEDGGFRTDTIIWVSVNPKDGFVSAVSFPRDLYVFIPGWGENRINTAFPRGGFELLADTFEYNFGIRPDHYALIDFNGFKSLINNLGGIDVYASQKLTDTCAEWINESGYCSVGPGTVHMNGELALWYVRSRYSSNDIDRARRGQEVIKAIFNRLMSLDAILRAPELFRAYSGYVQTDFTLPEIVPLLPLASTIKENGDIRNHVIGFEQAYSWITPQGAQVLVPDYEAIKAVMVEALMLR